MKTEQLTIGTMAVFNYDRKYMTSKRTRNHDGEKVTITGELFYSAGLPMVTVENEFNTIFPVMIQELTIQ